jgi:hypothetical protein
MSTSSRTPAEALLDYLETDLPGWPFDADVDRPFVEELADDFPCLDLVEQAKRFRWFYDNRPPVHRRPRLTLRRWMARARA